jgi:hypothetical protein
MRSPFEGQIAWSAGATPSSLIAAPGRSQAFWAARFSAQRYQTHRSPHIVGLHGAQQCRQALRRSADFHGRIGIVFDAERFRLVLDAGRLVPLFVEPSHDGVERLEGRVGGRRHSRALAESHADLPRQVAEALFLILDSCQELFPLEADGVEEPLLLLGEPPEDLLSLGTEQPRKLFR